MSNHTPLAQAAPTQRTAAIPPSAVPRPAVTDLDGLVDIDGHLRAALAAWDQLTPEQRRRYNKEAWLAAQQRTARYTREQQRAYDARVKAVQRRQAAENQAEAAKIRARQCPDCFLVKTPAGTCNCTE